VFADRRMTCAEFLESYAECRDDLQADASLRRAVDAHLGECFRCRRLAQTLTRGLALLHNTLEDVEPSARFRDRLAGRLRAEVTIGDPLAPTHAGLAAALLVATALGLLVVEGAVRGEARRERPVTAVTPPTFQPAISNVTLPAFTHSTLEFHGVHAPLGSYVLFGR
jgi:hypothetical protein